MVEFPIGVGYDHVFVKFLLLPSIQREKLTNILRTLIYEIFLEIFMRKEKIISHESDVKTFLK